jgi:hypothetical protein
MKRVANKIIGIQRVAVLVAVMLVASSSLFAQKSATKWRLFNSNKVEKEVVSSESNSIAVVSYDNYLKTLDFVIESKIELEDWMTDASSWEEELVTHEEIVEEELALEDWMLDFRLLDEIRDSELALEEWMNSTECWVN